MDDIKTLSERFHWMYGIEEYLQYNNHPDFDKYQLILGAIHQGDAWAIRELMRHEIKRGHMALTEQFLNIILLVQIHPHLGDFTYTDRDILQFMLHSIDDDIIRDINAWNDKWSDQIELADHFSRGQIKSNIWMMQELSNIVDAGRLGTVIMYGGWYSIVANMLFRHFNINKFYNIEVNASVLEMSEDFNRRQSQGRFKAVHQDVNQLVYNEAGQCMIPGVGMVNPSVVINTSCEHMTDQWFGALPKGQFVVLQTNNYFKNRQHTNCVSNIDEALRKYKFSQVLYSGELETYLYNRYMIIGIK